MTKISLGIHIWMLLHVEPAKLIWLFKHLRKIANMDLITYIYITNVQSVLLYCLPVWGGTFKTKFITIERAQRTILTVMLFKKRRYDTFQLYKDAKVLTVRQIIHSTNNFSHTFKHLSLDPNIKKVTRRRRRRRRPVDVIDHKISRTVFATRQYNRLSCTLYNNNIVQLNCVFSRKVLGYF